ncbi:MAG TPA: LPS export ABC transporter periplasmic protein LptC [Gammaproteobacteria bacterium]|nr:LPS export ABC transporter periplasmic protein LptC [Gammaproteobacteria bacterium]
MNLRFVAMLGVLALIAAGTLWLLRQTALQGIQGGQVKTHAPDYYFTDATVTSLDLKGNPASELSAPRMVHHPDDDSIEVYDPRMRYFAAGDPPWSAQADHALEPSGGKLVFLDGHVEMRRPDANGGPPLVIDTDRLTVDLATNVASTDDPVQMTKGVSHMTGVGMDAYMQDNRLVLRTVVRGFYVPKKD